MKEENKISIDSMRKKLQAVEHYDKPEKAFNDLLFGFAKARTILRNGRAECARKAGWK